MPDVESVIRHKLGRWWPKASFTDLTINYYTPASARDVTDSTLRDDTPGDNLASEKILTAPVRCVLQLLGRPRVSDGRFPGHAAISWDHPVRRNRAIVPDVLTELLDVTAPEGLAATTTSTLCGNRQSPGRGDRDCLQPQRGRPGHQAPGVRAHRGARSITQHAASTPAGRRAEQCNATGARGGRGGGEGEGKGRTRGGGYSDQSRCTTRAGGGTRSRRHRRSREGGGRLCSGRADKGRGGGGAKPPISTRCWKTSSTGSPMWIPRYANAAIDETFNTWVISTMFASGSHGQADARGSPQTRRTAGAAYLPESGATRVKT